MKKNILITAIIFTLFSCNKNENYDASGTFEANELMVTAEATGRILELQLEEGQNLSANQKIGFIDSKAAELQKEQILASIQAIDEKTNSATPQIQILATQINTQKANIAVLQEQLATVLREKNRTANLVKSDAATKKQLDDATSQVSVIQKQIEVAKAQLTTLNQQITSTKEQTSIQNRGILSEKNPNQKKVLLLDDQLKHNFIISPINGTVLTQYMYKGEFATVGKPIYKIANLDELNLRAYFTGDQLSAIKIGQNVKVFVDDKDQKTKELTGKIIWISQKSEFTPKTIQTKEERANLVYAVKIKVKNNGFLKIGMYGEVKL